MINDFKTNDPHAMKNLLFIIVFALISFTLASQSCLPEGIIFQNQADIDNFQVNFPGCAHIEGDVEIEGDHIYNLDGLSVVTAIGGQLYITNNDSLTDITGLSALTGIWGSLLISSNPMLTSLEGLESLITVPADVFISNNLLLNDISAIGNINSDSVAELWITSNAALSICDNAFICSYLSNPNGTVSIKNNAPGCANPPEVADDCGITLGCLPSGNYNFYHQADIDNFQANYPGCTELAGETLINGSDITNLAGLNVVTTINGSLKFFNCTQLESLAGIESITQINGPLSIIGNSLLTDISALNNLDTIGLTFLSISNNALLSNCAIEPVCSYLFGTFGASHCNVVNNDDGCKTMDEILMACSVGTEEIIYKDENQIHIVPNPAKDNVTVEVPGSSSKFQISIFNLNGQEIMKQSSDKTSAEFDISFLKPGIYFVKFEEAKQTIINKFVISR